MSLGLYFLLTNAKNLTSSYADSFSVFFSVCALPSYVSFFFYRLA